MCVAGLPSRGRRPGRRLCRGRDAAARARLPRAPARRRRMTHLPLQAYLVKSLCQQLKHACKAYSEC